MQESGYWNKEKCFVEAQKYETRNELKNNSSGAYEALRKHGWLDEACFHMEKRHSFPKGYWTKEKCFKEALKYKTRTDFLKFNSVAYIASQKHGWLKDICTHMTPLKQTWGKEECAKEALKHTCMTNFIKNASSAYRAAQKNKWLDEICAHMRDKYSDWTKERCIEEAKKYRSCNDFRRNCFKVYNIALQKGWINEISTLLILIWKHRWTKENCTEVAKFFNTRDEFREKVKTAYAVAVRKGWIEDICKHMSYNKEVIISPLTKEDCTIEAKKHTNKLDFRRASSSAYFKAKQNGWLTEICSHMKTVQDNIWTITTCTAEAKKYQSKTDFKKYAIGAWKYATENDVLDKVCEHMKTIGNRLLRCIYAFEFPDHCVYVGLTYNIQEREWEHLNKEKSAVYKHIQETGLTPILKIIHGYTEKEISQILEESTLNQYIENGWTPLNRIKTGGLGGNTIHWTKERCIQEAQKYEYLRDFRANSAGAYNAAHSMNILEEICEHMNELPKDVIWTKNKCQEVAAHYDTKSDFRKNEPVAYITSHKNKWFDDICAHMIRPKIHNLKWTKDTLIEEAKKYETKMEFLKNAAGAYAAANKLKILEKICSNMKQYKNQQENTQHEI